MSQFRMSLGTARMALGRWPARRNSASGWLVAALAGALAVGCGLQPHPLASDQGSGGFPSSSGGSASGGTTSSGGQSAGSGGTVASGGVIGSGGQTSGSSGGSSGSGDGSGGDRGSGGTTAGSGGSSASGGSGGNSASSGGTTAGSGGTTAGSGGSPASSGAGVMIDGKFVPKEKAVVFIHFGHSNMRGQATKPSSLMSYFYTPVAGLWSYKGSFTPAKEPTAPEANTATLAGPGMAILHSAQTAAGSNSGVQFISVGYGNGSKTSVDYTKSANTYYPIFMKWAGQLKGNVTFGAIVIMLGITDGEHLPTDQVPGFPGRIKQIVADIRADLGEPNLPVLFCDYEQEASGDLAPNGAVGKVMVPLIHMLPDMISKLVLVPTDKLEMQDDHHFDMQGHKDWANRVVMLMQSNNWFPWK